MIPFLDNMPTLDPHNTWLLRGYETLSSQRLKVDGRPQAIQVSEIAAYANYVGMADEADREDFLRIVLQLDKTALDFADDEARKLQAKAQRDSKRKSSGRAK